MSGARVFLPSCGTWTAAKVASAAFVAGLDPAGPEARARFRVEKARRGKGGRP